MTFINNENFCGESYALLCLILRTDIGFLFFSFFFFFWSFWSFFFFFFFFFCTYKTHCSVERELSSASTTPISFIRNFSTRGKKVKFADSFFFFFFLFIRIQLPNYSKLQ